MKKVLKWAGIGAGVFAGIMIVVLIGVYFSSQSRLNRVYEIPEKSIFIPNDPAAIENGKHIFQYRGCEGCHGEDLGGKVYLDDPAVGKVIASNMTTGLGGVGGEMTDVDWVRAIRHGVRPDGTGYLFMPSTEFYYLSDEDLGDVIAYIKSVPPVNNELPRSSLSMVGRTLMIFIKELTFIPAELIPHDMTPPTPPEVGITPEYGAYLSQSCHVCHGLTMSGGVIPGMPSNWPPAPNLTFGAGSTLMTWTEDGFITAMRTGVTPSGRELRSEFMPWTSYKFMNDDELKAVWAYLNSLPEIPYGNR